MQPKHISRAMRAARPPWLLYPLLALASALPASAAPGAPSAPRTYHVIQLSSKIPGNADINARGQVAFTESRTDVSGSRARFYDGRTIHDLGTLGGFDSFIMGLNEFGQVTGGAMVDPDTGDNHAYRWSRRTGMVDLNRPGMGNSWGSAINNRGWVAGRASFSDASPVFHAFRWTPRTGMADLGSLAQYSSASAINDAGTVVGYTEAAGGGILGLATRWPLGGGLQPLATIPSVASEAYDIDEAGQIVGGMAFDASLSDEAFLWSPRRGLRDLGTGASYLAYAHHINDRGLVIGNYYYSDDDRRPNGFIWSREHGLLPVGRLGFDSSNTADVNRFGQVVGYLNFRPYVWSRTTGFVDLQSRVRGLPDHIELLEAIAISDNGSIVVTWFGGMMLLVPDECHRLPPVAGPVKFTGGTGVDALRSFSASFKDVDVRESHTALWSWGDGSTSVGVVSESNGTGSVSAQHAYRKPGIYTASLILTDSSGLSTTAERTVVVCGAGTCAAGEGGFMSPQGASMLARDRMGSARASRLARFAFLSEAGGAVAAARMAQVHFNVGTLAFRSTRVDTVSVAGGRVHYEGSGTVNGKDGHRFTLTALAGSGAGKDRVQVRISHLDARTGAEVVDYDNAAAGKGKMAGTPADGSPALEAGSVQIGR